MQSGFRKYLRLQRDGCLYFRDLSKKYANFHKTVNVSDKTCVNYVGIGSSVCAAIGRRAFSRLPFQSRRNSEAVE